LLFRPCGACSCSTLQPTACAAGCILSPLCGGKRHSLLSFARFAAGKGVAAKTFTPLFPAASSCDTVSICDTVSVKGRSRIRKSTPGSRQTVDKLRKPCVVQSLGLGCRAGQDGGPVTKVLQSSRYCTQAE